MKKKFAALAFALLLLCGCGEKAENASVSSLGSSAATVEETAPPVATTTVVISELVAANRTAYASEDGLFPDYLRLRNDGSEAVTLEGWHLSQKEGRLSYTLPTLTLQSGESVTVACDGWGKGLHSDFSLRSSGESVLLSDAGGQVLQALTYPALGEDEGYVRCADGSYEIRDLSASGSRSPEGLRISECASFNAGFCEIGKKYYDWVELYNGGSEDIRLSDYTLSDKRSAEDAPTLADYTLRPGEYVVILCTGSKTPRLSGPSTPSPSTGSGTPSTCAAPRASCWTTARSTTFPSTAAMADRERTGSGFSTLPPERPTTAATKPFPPPSAAPSPRAATAAPRPSA